LSWGIGWGTGWRSIDRRQSDLAMADLVLPDASVRTRDLA